MSLVRPILSRLGWLAWMLAAANACQAAEVPEPAVAKAVSRGAAVVWLCGLSAELVQLVCIADAAPQPEPDAATMAITMPTARVNGTSFPLDPRRTWRVDLWTPPTERAHVELLARATICYRSPGCDVLLTWPGDGLARGRQRP